MRLPPCSSERHLTVAFGIARPLCVAALGMAAGTAHAFIVQGREAVRFAHRLAAAMAEQAGAWLQIMRHRHALIEHEAFALP